MEYALPGSNPGALPLNGRYVDINRPIFHWRRPFEEWLATRWITVSFLFSFEFDLTQTAPKLPFGGLQKWAAKLCKKTLAAPVFIVQNESCLPLKDSSCHHTRSGRDWPDMWRLLPLTEFIGVANVVNVRQRRLFPRPASLNCRGRDAAESAATGVLGNYALNSS